MSTQYDSENETNPNLQYSPNQRLNGSKDSVFSTPTEKLHLSAKELKSILFEPNINTTNEETILDILKDIREWLNTERYNYQKWFFVYQTNEFKLNDLREQWKVKELWASQWEQHFINQLTNIQPIPNNIETEDTTKSQTSNPDNDDPILIDLNFQEQIPVIPSNESTQTSERQSTQNTTTPSSQYTNTTNGNDPKRRNSLIAVGLETLKDKLNELLIINRNMGDAQLLINEIFETFNNELNQQEYNRMKDKGDQLFFENHITNEIIKLNASITSLDSDITKKFDNLSDRFESRLKMIEKKTSDIEKETDLMKLDTRNINKTNFLLRERNEFN